MGLASETKFVFRDFYDSLISKFAP